MRHIDDEILAGRWVNGSRLPPERELAASLSVSRGAVREAIRALEAQGILSSGTGRSNGTRVDARPSDAMGRILRLQLALDTAFHVALAEAGDNRLMSDLTVAIREAVHLPILEAEHSLIGWEQWRDGLVCDHQEMLAAIENGDSERAAKVTEAHIRNTYNTLLIDR